MPPDEEEPDEEQEQERSDGAATNGCVGGHAVGGVSDDYATRSDADDDPSANASG